MGRSSVQAVRIGNIKKQDLTLWRASSAVKEFEILKRLDETWADLLLSLIGKGKLDRVYDGQETQKMRSKKLCGAGSGNRNKVLTD
jgi:hypothetical protein